MAFDMQLMHWPTIAAFVAHLRGVPRPTWCSGITNHNTYIPNETQWAGEKSMLSMRKTYIGKGWTAGPHLYLAAQAPNPANTGIWQMTPLDHPGVHAGPCNEIHLGIESVGDFDARPPSADQYTLLLAVNRAILEHWHLTPSSVNVHNECMSGRTCPGKYLTGAQIRADLSGPWVTRYRAKTCAPIFQDRKPDAPLAGAADAGQVEQVDDLTGGWLHLRSGLGFTPLSCWEKV